VVDPSKFPFWVVTPNPAALYTLDGLIIYATYTEYSPLLSLPIGWEFDPKIPLSISSISNEIIRGGYVEMQIDDSQTDGRTETL